MIYTSVLEYIIKQYAIITYWVLILIQIIKWMLLYWDNKALPTGTLTLPNTFSNVLLFPKKKNIYIYIK